MGASVGGNGEALTGVFDVAHHHDIAVQFSYGSILNVLHDPRYSITVATHEHFPENQKF